MNRNRDNAPPLQSEGPQDMRTDTTPTDAAKLDKVTADAQEQTTSGRTAQETSPGDLQSIKAPATSGHIEAQESRKEGKKRKSKSRTSAAAVTKYQLNHYDRFELKLIAGDKQKLRDAAAAEGISANALIIKAINAYFDSDILTPLATNPYI